ncbi:transcriptional regulator, RpiR family [Rhizobiales bacterium GAS191]|nr:transcriptional regulator, RpiR family [Rhizobiales bacterium GAS113]SED67616.1 transcriptional regulator, RpiR family [Rhizobiales bacterium GAS191]
MKQAATFDERVADRLQRMSPAERRVARFFQDNREEVLISSAAALAAKAATSDATVLRASKALGFAGLDELRRALAAELRRDLSPSDRLTRTLGEIGDDLQAAFEVTLDIHVKALESLRRDIAPEQFRSAVKRIAAARRVLAFGIGPSSAMAEYFVIQLARFGLDAASLTRTGLLFADDLRRLREGDLVVILAYGRVYRELAALLDETRRMGLGTVLLTDTLSAALRRRVDQVLPVARGRSDMLSMHTATLGLIEALLVGIAATRPRETLASLQALNKARAGLVGEPVDLPVSKQEE